MLTFKHGVGVAFFYTPIGPPSYAVPGTFPGIRIWFAGIQLSVDSAGHFSLQHWTPRLTRFPLPSLPGGHHLAVLRSPSLGRECAKEQRFPHCVTHKWLIRKHLL